MVGRSLLSGVVAVASCLLLSLNGVEATKGGKPRGPGKWVSTWGTMPQLTEPHNLPPAPFNQSGVVFPDTTLRQTVHLSLGADTFRIRLANFFGGSDLPITAVTVALPAEGKAGVSAIVPGTVRKVTFSGESSVQIPNGAQAVSDPINFKVKPESNLAITIYLKDGQTTNFISGHPGSRTTSWLTFGNQVSATDLTGESKAGTNHWYYIHSVEAWAPLNSKALLIVGDSITDGRLSTDNGNNRWPDLLLARLQKNRSTRNIAVVNQAAGGNRILADGLGPNALGRIDRDVIAHPGAGYVIIFEGTNDIGTAPTDPASQTRVGDRVIWALTQMVDRLHTAGLPVFGATITAFSGEGQSYGHPEREKTRARVNKWIRTSGVFDYVLDFDKVTRNKTVPIQLADEYNGGDWLHPNVNGFQAMADTVPLSLFNRFYNL